MAKFTRTDKYTGMRNGMLVAIENRGPVKSDTGRYYSTWLFKCDCGNEKVLCPSDVFKKREGNPKIKGITSCGCNTKKLMHDAKIRPEGEAALTGLYATYKLSCAEQRGHDFQLTIEEFRHITGSNCFYCGKEPSQKKKSKFSEYIYNGIDRVDNSKGYCMGNVVAACRACNSLKSGITVEIAVKMLKFLGVINEKT